MSQSGIADTLIAHSTLLFLHMVVRSAAVSVDFSTCFQPRGVQVFALCLSRVDIPDIL